MVATYFEVITSQSQTTFIFKSRCNFLERLLLRRYRSLLKLGKIGVRKVLFSKYSSEKRSHFGPSGTITAPLRNKPRLDSRRAYPGECFFFGNTYFFFRICKKKYFLSKNGNITILFIPCQFKTLSIENTKVARLFGTHSLGWMKLFSGENIEINYYLGCHGNNMIKNVSAEVRIVQFSSSQ